MRALLITNTSKLDIEYEFAFAMSHPSLSVDESRGTIPSEETVKRSLMFSPQFRESLRECHLDLKVCVTNEYTVLSSIVSICHEISLNCKMTLFLVVQSLVSCILK